MHPMSGRFAQVFLSLDVCLISGFPRHPMNELGGANSDASDVRAFRVDSLFFG